VFGKLVVCVKAFLVRGAGRRGHLPENEPRETGANDGLLVQAVRAAPIPRPRSPPNHESARGAACPSRPSPRARVDQGARAGCRPPDSAGPERNRSNGLFLQSAAASSSHRRPMLRVSRARDAPVILNKPGKVRPVLADIPHRIDLPVGGPAEQEGRERNCLPATGFVAAAGPVPMKLKSAHTGDALTSEAVVLTFSGTCRRTSACDCRGSSLRRRQIV